MGGLDDRTWTHVWMAAPLVAARPRRAATALARDLDLFTTGEDAASTLGLDVERAKQRVLPVAALLAGTAVAVVRRHRLRRPDRAALRAPRGRAVASPADSGRGHRRRASSSSPPISSRAPCWRRSRSGSASSPGSAARRSSCGCSAAIAARSAREPRRRRRRPVDRRPLAGARSDHARRAGAARGPARPERIGQEHAAAPARRRLDADRGHRDARRRAGGARGAPGAGAFRRPGAAGHAHRLRVLGPRDRGDGPPCPPGPLRA